MLSLALLRRVHLVLTHYVRVEVADDSSLVQTIRGAVRFEVHRRMRLGHRLSFLEHRHDGCGSVRECQMAALSYCGMFLLGAIVVAPLSQDVHMSYEARSW